MSLVVLCHLASYEPKSTRTNFDKTWQLFLLDMQKLTLAL